MSPKVEPFPIHLEAQLASIFWCPSCGQFHTEEEVDDAGPMYECGDCGPFSKASADGHRCPQCNKFGSKIAEVACPEEGIEELEEISGYLINGTVYVDLDEVKEKASV